MVNFKRAKPIRRPESMSPINSDDESNRRHDFPLDPEILRAPFDDRIVDLLREDRGFFIQSGIDKMDISDSRSWRGVRCLGAGTFGSAGLWRQYDRDGRETDVLPTTT